MKREILSYGDFKTEVKKRIFEYLPNKYADYTVSECKIFKVNEELDCLNVMPPDDDEPGKIAASPNLYYNMYYKAYKSGMPLDKVISEMGAFVQKTNVDGVVEKAQFTKNWCKDKMVIQLINREKNKEYLKTLVHRDFLDLALICKMVVFDDERGDIISATITKDMLSCMEWNEEELFRSALEGYRDILAPEIFKISRELYTMTNKKHYLGAASIVEPKEIAGLSEELKSDLYVLPSSLHEVMLVPEKYGEVKMLRKLVWDANRAVVRINEWLSDEVYIYRRAEGVIRFAEKAEAV